MACDSKETEVTHIFHIDETYEFSAPRFFDFIHGETEEEICRAELWFADSSSYPPSPFMPKIKMERTVQELDCPCDFEEDGKDQKVTMSSDSDMAQSENTEHQIKEETKISYSNEQSASFTTQEEDSSLFATRLISHNNEKIELCSNPKQQISGETEYDNPEIQKAKSVANLTQKSSVLKANQISRQISEICTTPKQEPKLTPLPTSLKTKTAKPTSCIKKASVLKPKNEAPLNSSSLRCPGTDLRQENQAVKRQRLEGGRSRQILNVKERILTHKSNLGCTKKYPKDKETVAPFISMAEMISKFQSRTRDVDFRQNKSLSHEETASMIQRRPKLTLTRPKEPAFETAQRVRAVRVKSSVELEEEMLANIPRFKARPLNKKILEGPTLPAPQRSIPKPPEFQEFHLKTMERANQHSDTASIVSTTESCQNHAKLHRLTEPKTPRLETMLRARPPKVKSSQELELEELEKIPKFKAKPLNKKIFESHGDLGIIHCNFKRPLTIPQEFHFATYERIPPAETVTDLFDKISLCSENRYDHKIPRITEPQPFHLRTEERGMEKEKRFIEEVLHQKIEEENARIPKANPYPYTTDYPLIPPKREPKACTKPEMFKLESLVRHEEQVLKIEEEKARKEQEEAQMRIFKAQPILKEDPLPVPEKVRRPLTQVQQFELHVDHRAVDREEFDKKVREKEMMYKRYRDECETAKMMEEEKAVKQMRRTMVPQARPVPNFANPFLPQKSFKEKTKPKSPNFHLRHRSERRKVNGHVITYIR